ncbi:MAG: hypothetical protein GWP59_07180 [Chlamydiales bacterium]|nr:hypothetical protein [Chlamydiales bacterium]NCF71467.1 hypothetical protein [Chlamydiales bacterium]
MKYFFSFLTVCLMLLSSCQSKEKIAELLPKVQETFTWSRSDTTASPELISSLNSLIQLQNLPDLAFRDEHNLSVLNEGYEHEPLGLITRSQAGYYLLSYDASFPRASKDNFQLSVHEYTKPWTFKYIYQPKGSNLRNWDQRFSLTAETYLDDASKYVRLWLKSLKEVTKKSGKIQVHKELETAGEVRLLLESTFPSEGHKIAFLRFIKTANSIVLLKYENRNNFIPAKQLKEWKDVICDIRMHEKLLFNLDKKALSLIDTYYGRDKARPENREGPATLREG